MSSVQVNTRLEASKLEKLHVLKNIDPKYTVRYILEKAIDVMYERALKDKMSSSSPPPQDRSALHVGSWSG